MNVADSITNFDAQNRSAMVITPLNFENCSFIDIIHHCFFRVSNNMQLKACHLKALLDEDHINFFHALLSTQSETLRPILKILLRQMLFKRQSRGEKLDLGLMKVLEDTAV